MRDVPMVGVDLAALREEQQRRRLEGDPVQVEEFLARDSALAANHEAVLDLIYSEILLREELGERPTVEEYVARFPQFDAAIRRQFLVHDALGGLGSTDECAAAPTMSSTLTETSEPSASTVNPKRIGQYDILEVIGRGGVGMVYKGVHQRLTRRVVAIKVLRAGDQAAAETMARFELEADTVSRLKHDHIVPIYDYDLCRTADDSERTPYVVLEYVPGGTLAAKIGGTPLSPREAAELLLPIARAVEHAHQRGIIHRDLKPANILLTDDGKPKITDFGLAKQLDGDVGQTHTGAILGTPSYMAPEQAAGAAKSLGPASDVYALGAVLYEMLTGRPPFRADSLLNTLQQVVLHDPVPPRKLQPGVPRDLETICLHCLQKSSAQRYASAGDLADDLDRYLNGKPIHARPVPWWERMFKWSRRRPAFTALIVLGILSIIGSVVMWAGFTYQLQQARDHAENERDEAQRQSKRAAQILRHALTSVDDFRANVRAAKTSELTSGNTGSLLFKLACSYGRTSAALTKDKELLFEDRQKLADQYAVNAIKLLECATRVGFFHSTRTNNRELLKQHQDLATLRTHPRFRTLMVRLGLKPQ